MFIVEFKQYCSDWEYIDDFPTKELAQADITRRCLALGWEPQAYRIREKTPPQKDPQYVAQKHYTELKPEPIEVIEAWQLGYNLGNVIKYVSRCRRKPQAGLTETEAAIKDLEKAASYVRREINSLKGTPSWQ